MLNTVSKSQNALFVFSGHDYEVIKQLIRLRNLDLPQWKLNLYLSQWYYPKETHKAQVIIKDE